LGKRLEVHDEEAVFGPPLLFRAPFRAPYFDVANFGEHLFYELR
jgi:hypothetical protein